jgi:hypothetical protein
VIFYAEVEVYKSNNVFIDDLLKTNNLETTHYATDSKQQTDFFWYRESGLRINVGLQDIDIVPVYEEVEHDGDTDFVVGNPAFKADRELFRNIRFQHCRCLVDFTNRLIAYCFMSLSFAVTWLL